MEPKEFQQLLVDMYYDVRSYSGIYGKNCLGFTTEGRDETTAILNIIEGFIDGYYLLEADEELELDNFQRKLGELIKILKRSRNDSMGLGTIIYFPDIPFTGEERED